MSKLVTVECAKCGKKRQTYIKAGAKIHYCDQFCFMARKKTKSNKFSKARAKNTSLFMDDVISRMLG